MANNSSKSDWKHFKHVREIALERLCERALANMTDIASDSSTTFHDRFLQVYRTINECNEQIMAAFDMHSRSRMMVQLAIMQSLNLMEESEIQEFTQQVRDQLELNSSC